MARRRLAMALPVDDLPGMGLYRDFERRLAPELIARVGQWIAEQ